MSELVYSIKQVFDKDKGALSDNRARYYYIAPYQRGYKWESHSAYAQVPQMLIDIYEAFQYKTSEYFLQYITVKKIKDNNEDALEVIDGQQRLTTLSLLIYRINQLGSEKNLSLLNISIDKIKYFRYPNNIFENLPTNIQAESIEHQDQYYMVKAIETIDAFINLLQKEQKLSEFYNYLLNSVKLIFNIEDEHTNSEDVFENLNNNKVPLTNQYLIKGLLLTKAIKHTNSYQRVLSYKEVLDQRTIMGRIWDEINAWINQPEVAHFFFASKKGDQPDGMEGLLELVLKSIENSEELNNNIEDSLLQQYRSTFGEDEISKKQSMYELFNKFNHIIRDEQSAFDVLNLIKHSYRVLYNIWHNEKEFYNLFGYIRFYDTNKYDVNWTFKTLKQNRENIKKEIAEHILKIIPDLEGSEIFRYDKNKKQLTHLLLSYNVFLEKAERFDFFQYDHGNWTLEHLSPQNPKEEIKIPSNLNSYILDELQKKNEITEDIKDDIKKKLKNNEAIAIDNLPFLYDPNIDEHLMGNMALLCNGDNSAVSNNPFIIKRNIIIARRNEGSFVPYHTIALYEKSLNMSGEVSFTPDLFRWSKEDIVAHEQWMRQRNKTIRLELQKILQP